MTLVIAQLFLNPGHSGNEVYIYINGFSKTLQQAIDDGDFSSPFTGGGSYSGSIIHGHKGEQITVNVGGNIKNLQQVIDDTSLCNSRGEISPSIFGSDNYGNNGDEIEIYISGLDKTLQESINDGNLRGCPSYFKADGSSINPDDIIRRSGDPEDAIHFSLSFLTIPASEFDQTIPLTLTPGGAQSYDEAWFSNGTNAKVVGLFRRGDIIDSIPENGEINATITGEMIIDKEYYYGEITFWIGVATGS